MDERAGRGPECKEFSRNPSFANAFTIAASGTVILLGAGAAYFLTQASSEALATTASVLVTTGLGGLVVIVYLIAGRWPLPAGHDDGGEPGTLPRPITVRPRIDPDAQLLRILDDPRLGDPSAVRRARMHDRRPGAA